MNNFDKKYFAKQLRLLIASKGLDLQQIAEEANVDYGRLSRWQLGKGGVGSKNLSKLCNYFGVDVDYFCPPEVGGGILFQQALGHGIIDEQRPAFNLDLIVKRLDQYREEDRPARTVPRNRPNLRLSLDPVRARLQSK